MQKAQLQKALYNAAKACWLEMVFKHCNSLQEYKNIPNEYTANVACVYKQLMVPELNCGRVLAFIMYCKKVNVDKELWKSILLADKNFDVVFASSGVMLIAWLLVSRL
ncbi:hypothetical protein [Bufonid herpesvirus 1]|uniref:hypothetical protein n=1 Tax=Bufonid herpesvirus 1 TaxID=2282206 RepID=UPI000EB6AC15|nr:hypothetical protein [Bufonid herpesvirus 1]AXF48626.1 hypothetical protein [Bufonid herpesvirus 1]